MTNEIQELARKLEHTARDLRAHNIEHKHLFEAAEYIRTKSIPIPFDSNATYVNILRGSLLLSDESRRALCPDAHLPAPVVHVAVRTDEAEEDPDWNVVNINDAQIVWYSGYENDDPQQCAVEAGIATARALGVGLQVLVYGRHLNDEGEELIEEAILMYDAADLDKAKAWRESRPFVLQGKGGEDGAE